ncbi:MAG: gamma-glutamylcyclotransferase [Bacteroidales bacterium]|nr:gamma-glutamylcyclotransferase [Bacteroidales bacterium]
MLNNLHKPNIPLFVFGTLRKGGRLDFYMEGSQFQGMGYTQGKLMKSEIGSAYIDFSDKNAYTIGELYLVNFYCLLRIDHLESTSGEFPAGYDLDIIPYWPYSAGNDINFSDENKSFALFYRRRNTPVKIQCGDWINRKKPIEALEKFLVGERDRSLTDNDIIKYLTDYLTTY